jgi:hypothetical protein
MAKNAHHFPKRCEKFNILLTHYTMAESRHSHLGIVILLPPFCFCSKISQIILQLVEAPIVYVHITNILCTLHIVFSQLIGTLLP